MIPDRILAGHFLSSMPSAQHAYADRVEGSEPHPVGCAADQLRHAVEHFARRLVGEGDGQDLRRAGLAGEQQMGDAGGEYPGLPGAGAGQHQKRPTGMGDGMALFVVQPLQMGRGRNGAPRRQGIGRNGVICDFERIGGRRHAPSYSNRGGGRLSLRLWTRVVRGGGVRMARGLNGSANGAGHWPPPGDEGVVARTPGGGSNLPPAVVAALPAVVGVKTTIPESRRSAQTLGTEREGHGILGYDYESGFGLVRTETPMRLTPLRFGDSDSRSRRSEAYVAGLGGEKATLKVKVAGRREFAGYWEYLLDSAIFTVPAYPLWGGSALIGRDGELLGVGSLLVQEALGGRRWGARL